MAQGFKQVNTACVVRAVIPALGRLRQKDHKFTVSLDYIGRSRLNNNHHHTKQKCVCRGQELKSQMDLKKKRRILYLHLCMYHILWFDGVPQSSSVGKLLIINATVLGGGA
jgi:hypothetical protein